MNNEETQIRAVIDAYVTGFNRGDKDMLLGAFHRNFVSAGFVGGNPQWDSGEDFADFCAEAAPDPDGPVPEWQMQHLSISGQTAVAIIRDQWGERQFIDSLTLLKQGDQWQIAFKAFHGLV